MKTTKILTVIFLFVATAFVSKVNAQDNNIKYYYYAYLVDRENNKLYVTSVLYKQPNTNTICTFTDAAVSNQFYDYIKAEFRVSNRIDWKGSVFSFRLEDYREYNKAQATKYLRSTMKLYDDYEIIRVKDFEFLCSY